jgi:hypothetical protein
MCVLQDWLGQLCTSNGWSPCRSPIVWRELIDRGGKGTLIGGASEFQEYVASYYGIQSNFTSDDALKVQNWLLLCSAVFIRKKDFVFLRIVTFALLIYVWL